jgi:hypothetical protein
MGGGKDAAIGSGFTVFQETHGFPFVFPVARFVAETSVTTGLMAIEAEHVAPFGLGSYIPIGTAKTPRYSHAWQDGFPDV